MPNPSQVCKDGDAFLNHDAVINEGLANARLKLQSRAGLLNCEDCGAPILSERIRALPNARTCISCQKVREA